MDRIELHGMSFLGRHGVREAERAKDQEFNVDVDIEVDLSAPAATDQLTDTIDYTFVRAAAKEVIEGPPHRLLESLAGEIGLTRRPDLDLHPRKSRFTTWIGSVSKGSSSKAVTA